jgi:hypothetical protein
MNRETFVKYILNLVSNSKIDIAFNLVKQNLIDNSDFHKKIIIISARQKRLDDQRNLGVIDNEEINIEQNKINLAFIEFIKEAEFKDEIDTNLVKQNNQKTLKNINRNLLPLISLVCILLVISLIILYKNRMNNEPNVQKKSIIVLMDSPLRDVVYNFNDWQKGRTNADIITEILNDLPIQIIKETTSLNWLREEQVYNLKPSLIIIHASCFYDKTNIEDADRKFYSFLDYISSLDVKILIYSRGFHHEEIWVNNLIKDIPQLKDKVKILKVEMPKDFNDPTIRNILKQYVKQDLKLN